MNIYNGKDSTLNRCTCLFNLSVQKKKNENKNKIEKINK